MSVLRPRSARISEFSEARISACGALLSSGRSEPRNAVVRTESQLLRASLAESSQLSRLSPSTLTQPSVAVT